MFNPEELSIEDLELYIASLPDTSVCARAERQRIQAILDIKRVQATATAFGDSVSTADNH
jgi:hypothetical protein